MRIWVIIFVALCWIGVVQAQTDPELTITVSVDNATPFVSQALTYTVSIRSLLSLSEMQLTEPDFAGLGRSDQIDPAQSTTETVGEQNFTTITQVMVLYPLRTGSLEIEPYRVALPETPFQAAQTFASESLQIDVQPLPADAPPSFNNAIGQFETIARIDPTTIQTGDAIILSLEVTGSGNIERLRPPELNLPNDWQIFERPSRFQRESLLFGTQTFTWSVIPTGVGQLELPSINFSFVEPFSGQYITRRTPPLPLVIEESVISEPSTEAPPNRASLPPAQAPALRVVTSAPASNPNLPETPFWFLWLIAPSIFVLVWIVGPRQSQAQADMNSSAPNRARGRSANTSLDRIKVDDPHAAYAAIQTVLLDAISQKVGRAVTVDSIEQELGPLPEKVREAFIICLQESSSGAYAPITTADAQSLIERSKRVLSAIDKAAWS